MSGVDFSRSTPLKQQHQVNTVIYALLNANPIENTDTMEHLPDAVIWISDPKDGTTYIQVDLWLSDDAIVFTTGSKSGYKVIDNAYYFTELRDIIVNQASHY